MQRPLGGIERMYWLLGLGASVNIVAIARIAGPLDPEVLAQALALAQRRHPMLRARLVELPGGPVFDIGEAPPIPLRVFPRTGADHWRALAEEQMMAGLPPGEAPPMRAFLLRGASESDLLLVYHHMMGDGAAGTALVRELVLDAGALTAGGKPQAEPHPLAPPLPTLYPPHPPAALRGPPAGERPELLPRDREAPLAERKARFLHLRLPEERTTALVARSRAAGTTLVGWMGAALLEAVAHEIGPGPHLVGTSQPINLRDHLVPPPQGFGYFSFGPPTFHRAGPGMDLGQTARDIKGGLTRAVEDRTVFSALEALDAALPRTRDALPAFLARADQSPVAAGVTNVGRFEGVRAGPLSWDDFHFMMNVAHTGPLVVPVLTTLRGRLSINMLYPEPLVSRIRAQRILDRMCATAEGAA